MACRAIAPTSYITSLADLQIGGCVTLKGSSSGVFQISFPPGKYLIELWGASGGGSSKAGGKGGFSSGKIKLNKEKVFYFFIGTAGGNSAGGSIGSAGFNGGKTGANDPVNNDCASGGSGGASDMRTTFGNFDSEQSLLSRIIVAGGGGSGACGKYGGIGGHAGGINGSKGSDNNSGKNKGGLGGTQSSGFLIGIGERGNPGDEAGGSGGGGYWGGFGGKYASANGNGGGGGGGGSSFVSGNKDCIAMDESKKPLSSPNHPSFVFEDSMIIAGNNPMPSFADKNQLELIGHSGNGCCRITFLGKPIHQFCTCCKSNSGFRTFLVFTLLMIEFNKI